MSNDLNIIVKEAVENRIETVIRQEVKKYIDSKYSDYGVQQKV